MEQAIAYGRALYYPYINFQREHWVKMAALFYEGIDRIVPDQLRESENELVKQLNEDEEFVRNVDPGHAADAIAGEFLEFAERELKNSARRRRIIKDLDLKVRKSEPYRIHSHKLSMMLGDALPRMGLAKRSTSRTESPWFEFEPVTGALYMTVLANRIASGKRIPVVTDTALFQPLINSIQIDDHPSGEDISLAMATVVVESAVPQGLNSVPMRTILRFRREHREEMRQFYIAINDLVKDLHHIDDPALLEDILQFRGKVVQDRVRALSLSLKTICTTLARNLLTISVPQLMQGRSSVWIAVGLASAAGATIAEEGIKGRATKAGSPYSYVLSLRRRLRPDSFAKSLMESRVLL